MTVRSTPRSGGTRRVLPLPFGFGLMAGGVCVTLSAAVGLVADGLVADAGAAWPCSSTRSTSGALSSSSSGKKSLRGDAISEGTWIGLCSSSSAPVALCSHDAGFITVSPRSPLVVCNDAVLIESDKSWHNQLQSFATLLRKKFLNNT